MSIRVVDGGGDGFRRADVDGTTPRNFQKSKGPLKRVEDIVDFACKGLPRGTEGIAFALAGVIEDKDLVVNSPNVHCLDGVRLASAVRDRTKGMKAAVFNDMEAAVTGMAALVPDEPFFLGITWSSGIGLRVWTEGRLLSVAEGGHMLLDPSPFAPLCGCGKRGHAEAIVGGKAIRRLVLAETQARGVELPDDEPSKLLIQGWKAGVPWAVEVQRIIARGMGMFLGNIQSLLHLPLIVWKGTFALNAMASLERLIRQEMKAMLIDPSWADRKNLAFRISPGADPHSRLVRALKVKFAPDRDANLDSLVGAAQCLRAAP
jgi:predicted NBD/HSP70 family sugar kinase